MSGSDEGDKDMSQLSPKVAAGMLIYRFLVGEYQYLLLQASFAGKLHWTPAKGHADPGEDKMQTAVRETEEESGLGKEKYEIDNNYPPIVLKYTVNGHPKTVDYRLARLRDPQTPIKLSHEHVDFKWVTLDSALKMVHADMGLAMRNVDKYLRNKPN